MDIIKKTLSRIGLSEKEITIYLECLRLGPQGASNIARHTKISRATVYDIFNLLIKKGLANKRDHKGTTTFEVLDPEHLLDHLEREKEAFIAEKNREKRDIADIIPVLKSIEPEKTRKPKVQFFEGESGLQKAYEKTLETESAIRAYANVGTIHDHLPGFFPKYAQKRASAEILIRAIMPDNKSGKDCRKEDQSEARETKLVDHTKYDFSPEVNIFDDKVLYASWKEKMAVVIESEEIAAFHKTMFDLLWSKL